MTRPPPIVFGVLAYTMWGLVSLYYDLTSYANFWEVVAHRMIWSVLCMTPLVCYLWRDRLGEIWHMIRQHYLTLLLTSVLIGINWLVLVYGVAQGRVLETSLGYFLSPLVSVALGMVVLREKIAIYERIACGLAVLGVAIRIWDTGGLPWITGVLAVSFSAYGVVHKRSGLPADASLMVETWIMLPVSLLLFYWVFATDGSISYGHDLVRSIQLMFAGLITVVPLWLFIYAAKNMPISRLGFLFFLTPSISFVLGLVYFGETIGWVGILSFSCIWLALALVTFGAGAARKKIMMENDPI